MSGVVTSTIPRAIVQHDANFPGTPESKMFVCSFHNLTTPVTWGHLRHGMDYNHIILQMCIQCILIKMSLLEEVMGNKSKTEIINCLANMLKNT